MIIAIKDLQEGINEFEQTVLSGNYDLPESYFYPNPISLKVFVDKLENMFRFKISILTEGVFSCDLCLKPYHCEVRETIEQIYQLGESDLDSDEIEILPGNSKEIDISKAIHDVFVLNRPIKLLCRDDCKGLCANCGADLNKQKCSCQRDFIDPRLENLKTLLK
jgi:uncharacterized protein